MKRKSFIRKDEEGVSPVIATILMIAITVVLAAVLYLMNSCTPYIPQTPTGDWGDKTVVGSTEVVVEYGPMNLRVMPMNLELILVMNDDTEGKYRYSSNDDGELTQAGGAYIGTLTYEDLADNQQIDIGDEIILSDLAPNSNYELIMAWAPTGDQIATTTFSTPSV